MIASNRELQTIVNDNHASTFLKTMDENLTEPENEKFTKSFIKKLKFHFKQEVASIYIEALKDQRKELEEELKDAKEDEEYLKNRRYIGQEEFLGGPVSEEERAKEMQESQQKQELLNSQLKKYNSIEAELQAVRNKTMVSA